MKRYFSLILAIAATVSAQIVPSTGNVRGPTSATDNAVARYDGTTGKLIQNSGVTIDDSGNLTVSGTGTSAFYGPVTLSNTASTASYQTGLRLSSTVSGAPNTVQSLEFYSSSLGVAMAAVDALRESGSYASSLRFWSTTGPGVLTENMRLTSGGNFLIGTTDDSSNGKLQLATHTTSAGGIGFGTAASLHADGNNGYLALTPPSGTTAGYRLYNSTTLRGQLAYSGTDVYLDSSTGSLILRTGSSTTAITINSSQALRLNGYGAGALTTDSSGNVTATSDERAKNIIGTFSKGLAEVVKLTPKTYTWKPETGLNPTDEVVSLTAQDLIAAGLPEAVSTYRTVADLNEDGTPKLDADGKALTKRIDATYTVSDRTIIAALVNAVKELNAKVAALEAARN